TWLPFYLVRERGFSMEQMARVGAAGYLLGAVSTLVSGWLSDRWIASGSSPTIVRKAVTGGSIALSGLLVGLASVVDRDTNVVLLLLGMAAFGAATSNVYAISQRLAGPNAAGRWVGFQNGFGNLAGVVAPVVTGFAVSRTGHFSWAFIILTAVCLMSGA